MAANAHREKESNRGQDEATGFQIGQKPRKRFWGRKQNQKREQKAMEANMLKKKREAAQESKRS
jgi:hypothetical protein